MDFLDIVREKAFLGREFLTWLWFKSEQTGGMIEMPGKAVIEVIFLDKMTLDLLDSETPQSVAIKGEHSQLREGLAALKEGKKIEEARISIKKNENDFSMVVKGTWFLFGAFKTPPILPEGESEEEEGPEARFLEKAYLVEEGMAAIDELFEYFLHIRISEEWEKRELPDLKHWVESAS